MSGPENPISIFIQKASDILSKVKEKIEDGEEITNDDELDELIDSVVSSLAAKEEIYSLFGRDGAYFEGLRKGAIAIVRQARSKRNNEKGE